MLDVYLTNQVPAFHFDATEPRPGVIHGASAAQTRYSFSGIKVSSPVLTTSENVFHISSQSDRGANNRG